MQKKVLIISSCFYPENRPGCHRVASFGKYFPDSGWAVEILCPNSLDPLRARHWDKTLLDRDPCQVHRVDCPLFWVPVVDKARMFLAQKLDLEILRVYAPERTFFGMLKAGQDLLRKTSYDMLLATSPDTYTLAVAKKLSAQFQVPWVADFRDLPGELKDPGEKSWLEQLAFKTVVNWCRTAGAVVTVSQPLADILGQAMGQKVGVVYNGFEEMPAPCSKVDNVFKLVYCGRLSPERDLSLLFDGLDLLYARHPELLKTFQFQYFGPTEHYVIRAVKGRPCEAWVQCGGLISLQESLLAQVNAAALLLISHKTGVGIMTSKIFEYLASGRPILSVPGDGDVTDAVLQATGAGVVASTPHDVASQLESWLKEWSQEGNLSYDGNQEAIDVYSRANQSAHLVKILNTVVDASTA